MDNELLHSHTGRVTPLSFIARIAVHSDWSSMTQTTVDTRDAGPAALAQSAGVPELIEHMHIFRNTKT